MPCSWEAKGPPGSQGAQGLELPGSQGQLEPGGWAVSRVAPPAGSSSNSCGLVSQAEGPCWWLWPLSLPCRASSEPGAAAVSPGWWWGRLRGGSVQGHCSPGLGKGASGWSCWEAGTEPELSNCPDSGAPSWEQKLGTDGGDGTSSGGSHPLFPMASPSSPSVPFSSQSQVGAPELSFAGGPQRTNTAIPSSNPLLGVSVCENSFSAETASPS